MGYESYLFEEEEETPQKVRSSFLSRIFTRKKGEQKGEQKGGGDETRIPSFYTQGTSLIEQEEAERAVTQSLLKRLQENPFTWYDYIIFLIEVLLFILLILSILGKLSF